MTSRRRGRLAALAIGLCLVTMWGVGATSAGATTSTPVQDNTPDVSIPRIIPLPNQGEAPKHVTDPGGWAQYAVFWGMCAAILLIFGLVVRESRHKLRDRAAEEAQSRSSTRSEPVAETSEKAPESSARQ